MSKSRPDTRKNRKFTGKQREIRIRRAVEWNRKNRNKKKY